MWNDYSKIKPSESGTYFVKLSNGDVGVADYNAYISCEKWDVNYDIIDYNILDDSGFYTKLESDVKCWMEIPSK